MSENRENRKRKANSQNIDGKNPFPHYNSNENSSQVPWDLEHWRRRARAVSPMQPMPLSRPPRRKTPTPPPPPPPPPPQTPPRRRRNTPPPPNTNSNNAYAYNFNTSNAQPDEFKLRRLREKYGDRYIMEKYGINLARYLGIDVLN